MKCNPKIRYPTEHAVRCRIRRMVNEFITSEPLRELGFAGIFGRVVTVDAYLISIQSELSSITRCWYVEDKPMGRNRSPKTEGKLPSE